jgi:Ca-activated chloride channel family protein
VLLLPFTFFSVFGQGILVNESKIVIQLPRPIILHPKRPHPIPPRPAPQPPESNYTIKSLEVNANVKEQVADVNVSQTFVNTGKTQMEVSFVFPLPYDGAINSMTLLVNGKEYGAKLLDAKEARKTYEDIVRRNQDPALLEWIGNGMFKTSVFPIPAGESREINLKYSQLLKVDGGLTDFLFPMSTAKYTAKPIEKLEINVNIESPDEIKNIYSPTHEIKIKRPTARKASVAYDAKSVVPSSDFRLFYDSGKNEVSTRLLSFRPDPKEDGYFMLLASPQFSADASKQIAKNVMLVLDSSGSMSGQKIIQAREALKFVLNNLHNEDTFNIIQYNNNATKFKDEIQPVKEEIINEANSYTESIRASGGTNIGEALEAALGMIQDKKTPNYVLFLTDGCPTVGVTDELKLSEIATAANKNSARVFVFGVGYDVNGRLLDRIARGNRGQTEYVKPNENIEDYISRMYNRINAPVLTDVVFNLIANSNEQKNYVANRVYPSGKFDLFKGEQLVIVGRYSKAGNVTINVEGKVGDETKTFKFEGNFVDQSIDQSSSFISRLWAIRRIGEILDQIDLKGQNKELVDELVNLSTVYGILTPYTSFLADENVALTDFKANAKITSSNTLDLNVVSGMHGVEQRAGKLGFQKALTLDSFDHNNKDNLAKVEKSKMRSGYNVTSAPNANMRLDKAEAEKSARRNSDVSGRISGYDADDKADTAIGDPKLMVQNINNRAFFNKAGIWIDSTLTESQMKPENIITVKQFSDEYFKLIDQYKNELAPFLTLGGSQIVNVKGKAYKIEP